MSMVQSAINQQTREIVLKYKLECDREASWTDTMVRIMDFSQYTIIVSMTFILLISTYLGYAKHRSEVYPGTVMLLQEEAKSLRKQLDSEPTAQSAGSDANRTNIARQYDLKNRQLDELLNGRHSDFLLPVMWSTPGLRIESAIRQRVDEVDLKLASGKAAAVKDKSAKDPTKDAGGDTSNSGQKRPADKPVADKPVNDPQDNVASTVHDPAAFGSGVRGVKLDWTQNLPAGYIAGLNLGMSILTFLWGLLETLQRQFHLRERRMLSRRTSQAFAQVLDSTQLREQSLDPTARGIVDGVLSLHTLYLKNRQALDSEPPSLNDFNNLSSLLDDQMKGARLPNKAAAPPPAAQPAGNPLVAIGGSTEQSKATSQSAAAQKHDGTVVIDGKALDTGAKG